MIENAPTDRQTIQTRIDDSPFNRFLQLTCDAIGLAEGTPRLRMPIAPALQRADGSGQCHGGPIASLIDVAGDMAVAMNTLSSVPTINFRVDYIRPSTGSYLDGCARVRRIGRTVGVVDIDVFDDQNRLTAIGRGCFGTAPD